jgi:hypothetical protein
MRFRNNNDLHGFVEELLEFLRSQQEIDLADLLAHANRFLSVSSTDYLNEVELALTRVLVLMPKCVSAEREDEIRQVIRQIGETFESARGA